MHNSLLTVDFHEGALLSGLNGDNALTLQKGFWFQLSGQDRQRAREPWGPANPQALNRYAYVLDNPLRYTDPTGHFLWVHDINQYGGFAIFLSRNDVRAIKEALSNFGSVALGTAAIAGIIGAVLTLTGIGSEAGAVLLALARYLSALGATAGAIASALDWILWSGGSLVIGCLTSAPLPGLCGAYPYWTFMGPDPGKIPDGPNHAWQCADGSLSIKYKCGKPYVPPPDPGPCGSPAIPCGGCTDCPPGSYGPPPCGNGYPGCPPDGRSR
jgi:hypothetical protein